MTKMVQIIIELNAKYLILNTRLMPFRSIISLLLYLLFVPLIHLKTRLQFVKKNLSFLLRTKVNL